MGVSGQSAKIRVVIANMGSESNEITACMEDSCENMTLPSATIDSEGILTLPLNSMNYLAGHRAS